MSRFVKVKYTDRYTKSEGNDVWLNLDNVVSVDEVNGSVMLCGGHALVINEESMPALIEALKGDSE